MMGDFKETDFIILSSPIKIPDHLFYNNVNVNGPKKWLKNNFNLFASNTTEYSHSNASLNILVIELKTTQVFFSEFSLFWRDFLDLGIQFQSNARLMLNIPRINIISSFM